MRAVVSRAPAGSSRIATVGTLDQCIITAKRESFILRRAHTYASGRPYRVEFFAENIYRPPFKTLTFGDSK